MTTILVEASMIWRITSRWAGVGVGEHGMKRRDDRHFEARQELDDIAAGLATENSVFVLKGDNVETCIVQEFGRPHIVADHLFADLEAHGRWIVIGATRDPSWRRRKSRVAGGPSRPPDADHG